MSPSALLLRCLLAPAAEPPTVTVVSDDTSITQSCRVVIPAGRAIPDANNNGVIQIDADNVTVEFDGDSALRGAPAGTAWDTLSGCGIRVNGHSNVTLKNIRVHGYKSAIYATKANRLTLDTADLSDNYRQRLRSTPAAEDAADWLFPHKNDANEWLTQHGAAVYVEDSEFVTVTNVTVRRAQNGIVFDRVTKSRAMDNDCSFLSGWGMAMWRSSRCTVSRNAFDFCVRGYSHSVYNRGQDSAGILCFEQCTSNLFAENSVTHSGDGFFGFAGREAIGETPKPADDFTYGRRGCNDNILVDNDFSYAVAHGIEMTFSAGNRFIGNRLVQCGICGIWGGYSQGTVIAKNIIEDNGQMAYGLERGGINMEHASRNIIIDNAFKNNACGVHLWWDDDGALLEKPGVAAMGAEVVENVIARNTFDNDNVALQLRATAPGHLRDNYFVENIAPNLTRQFEAPRGEEPVLEGHGPTFTMPKFETLGKNKPVGARAALSGRQNIIMDEWGPWDHQSPMIRRAGRAAGDAVFEIYGLPGWDGASSAEGSFGFDAASTGRDLSFKVTTSPPAHIEVVPGTPTLVKLAGKAGVWTYDGVSRAADGPQKRWKATVIAVPWDLVAFPWTKDADPREKLEAWRALATGPEALRATVPALDFPFGGGGPRGRKWSDEMSARGPGPDHFGIIAKATIPFPKGRWRATVTSDDGVRLRVAGAPVVENWTWHGPTKNSGEFSSNGAPSPVEVEYFEIDGHAVLEVSFEPLPDAPANP